MPIPSLPLDIIFEIVSHLEEEEKVEQQIQAGKLVSLVCRSSRALGQRLRWRTVKIKPQQLPSLLDHFVRFPLLAKLVRDFKFLGLLSDDLDTGDVSTAKAYAQLPQLLETLVNLQVLLIQGKMENHLLPILKAASYLFDLRTFTSSLQLDVKNNSQKLSLHRLVLFWRIDPADASQLTNDFLSIFDPTAVKEVGLVGHTACPVLLECLIGFPNLVNLDLRMNSEVLGDLSQLLPVLARLSSLETVMVVPMDIEEEDTIESSVSLSEVLACFSPSLRIFSAKQFIFPDFYQIPVRQAATRERSVNTRYIMARRPRDMAGGGSTDLLLWGDEEEGKVNWFRHELGAVAKE
ncbi:hypothetical protein JCM5350_005495 [Sporobolomyces pararoseus]